MPDTHETTHCGTTAVVCAGCAPLASLAREVPPRGPAGLDDDVLVRRRNGDA